MRLFIYHDSKGKIISVMKANILAESVDQPYGQADEKTSVIEIELSKELEALDCHEISEQYVVDAKTKKLKRMQARAARKKPSAKKKPGPRSPGEGTK